MTRFRLDDQRGPGNGGAGSYGRGGSAGGPDTFVGVAGVANANQQPEKGLEPIPTIVLEIESLIADIEQELDDLHSRVNAIMRPAFGASSVGDQEKAQPDPDVPLVAELSRLASRLYAIRARQLDILERIAL